MSEFKISELTLETVKANARDYYRRERLGAQIPDPKDRSCKNYYQDYPEYRCAVAASYPEKLCKEHREACFSAVLQIDYLSEGKPLILNEEQTKIAWIQVLHDQWAMTSQQFDLQKSGTSEDVKNFKERFLEAIDYKELSA